MKGVYIIPPSMDKSSFPKFGNILQRMLAKVELAARLRRRTKFRPIHHENYAAYESHWQNLIDPKFNFRKSDYKHLNYLDLNVDKVHDGDTTRYSTRIIELTEYEFKYEKFQNHINFWFYNRYFSRSETWGYRSKTGSLPNLSKFSKF